MHAGFEAAWNVALHELKNSRNESLGVPGLQQNNLLISVLQLMRLLWPSLLATVLLASVLGVRVMTGNMSLHINHNSRKPCHLTHSARKSVLM